MQGKIQGNLFHYEIKFPVFLLILTLYYKYPSVSHKPRSIIL
jgi:hypothetical protein